MREEGFKTILFRSYTCYMTFLNFKNSQGMHEGEFLVNGYEICSFFFQIIKMTIKLLLAFSHNFYAIYLFAKRIKHLSDCCIMDLHARLKHHDPLSKSLHFFKIMSREYYRHAIFTTKLVNKLPDNFSLLDIHSCCWFIEDEKLWTMYERTSKHESSLHAT